MGGNKFHLGWREWVALPELGIPRIKAKVDTGARTSALHTFHIERFQKRRHDWVKFWVHPVQNRRDIVIECASEILNVRYVTDSGGHRESRIVIETPVAIGNQRWPIEITLTDRDTMKFRMLLGRTALHKRFVVDPSRSFLSGEPICVDRSCEIRGYAK